MSALNFSVKHNEKNTIDNNSKLKGTTNQLDFSKKVQRERSLFDIPEANEKRESSSFLMRQFRLRLSSNDAAVPYL